MRACGVGVRAIVDALDRATNLTDAVYVLLYIEGL